MKFWSRLFFEAAATVGVVELAAVSVFASWDSQSALQTSQQKEICTGIASSTTSVHPWLVWSTATAWCHTGTIPMAESENCQFLTWKWRRQNVATKWHLYRTDAAVLGHALGPKEKMLCQKNCFTSSVTFQVWVSYLLWKTEYPERSVLPAVTFNSLLIQAVSASYWITGLAPS